MSRKFRSIGNRQRACYLKAGDVVALKAAPSLPSGQHFAATNARDAVAATIQRVETSRRGGRLTYTLHCLTEDGREIVSRGFFGQNAIPAPIFV
jgi:hypothetical protein